MCLICVFFFKNNWQINEEVLKEKTGMTLSGSLIKAQKQVKSIKSTELLSGLGELIDNKQKAWVKEKMIDEAVFQLRLYDQSHKKK